ncbi:MAG: extracellular solute-binding protein [Lachnospiraceae bacterium]|nr:extracellular solute-binding protein [Lachnospiraceae bacterium]
MKMKRVVSVLLAGVMTLALVACGSTPAPAEQPAADTAATTEEAAPAADTAAETTADTAISDEPVTLTMWCIATEGDSNRHAYEQAIADMQTKYPNVTLEWEAIENEAYKQKISAAMASGEGLPDIFFTWSCAFLGDFVDQGRVYCLDDVLAKYSDELPESMLGNTTYDGKHYGVPTTMNIVALFANMDLLAQAGWDKVPENYDELIKCCDDLVAAGIIPFGCAGGETWCVTEYLEPIIEKSIGADALNDIFLGRATYNNADVAKAVDTFQEMIDKGYFDPAGASLPNDDVKANFIAGRTAFYQNGTWNCADFASNEEFLPKVKVTEFPVIDSSKSKLGQLIGGPSDTLAVTASSPNAEIAAEYAAELGKLICHYGYLDGCGLPAWTPYGDTSNINPLTQSVAEICKNADSYVLFGDTAMSAVDKDPYLDAVAKVYGKKLDGQGFIDELAGAIR